jgi:hypothetical protein
MKIGLSYSRCIRDIVDGAVDIDDVLVLITRTDFDPHDDEQWSGIWRGYGGGQSAGSLWSNPEWSGYPAEDEVKFRDVSKQLWRDGKLHQPRKFGARPSRLPYHWLESVLTDDELEQRPAVKEAWDRFKVLAGLSAIKVDQLTNEKDIL